MFKVSVNDLSFKEKPKGAEYALVQTNWRQQEFNSVRQFADHVEAGKSFKSATLQDYSSPSSWCSQQVWCIDFDNEARTRYTTEDVRVALQGFGIYPNLIYHTFSSTELLPKFRVVLITDVATTNPDAARSLLRGLSRMFPGCDPAATKDIVRLYLGTKPQSVDFICEELIPFETLHSLAETYNGSSNDALKNYWCKNSVPTAIGLWDEDVSYEQGVVILTSDEWEKLYNDCKIYQDFANGNWLHHPQLFGLLTNMAKFKGGLLRAKEIMDKMGFYSDNNYRIMNCIRRYNYRPQTLSAFSPYESDWEYPSFHHVVRNVRTDIKVTNNTRENNMPVAVAQAHMHKFLEDSLNRGIVKTEREGLEYEGENLYIMRVATSVGKTSAIKKYVGQELQIAFPTHKLQREFYDSLSEQEQRMCVLSPEIPEFSPQVNQYLTYLYNLRLVERASSFIYALAAEGKTPQGFTGKFSSSDRAKALLYKQQNDAVRRARNVTVLTTHFKAAYHNHRYETIIFDEDPTATLFAIGSIRTSDLLVMKENAPSLRFQKELDTLLARLRVNLSVERTPLMHYFLDNDCNVLRKYFADGKTVGASFVDFVNSYAYTVNKGIGGSLEEDPIIEFIQSINLFHNKKTIICSATVPTNLYKRRYPHAVVIDLTAVEVKGTQNQYLNSRTSISALTNKDGKNVTEIKRIIQDAPRVITYKSNPGGLSNVVKDVYPGNATGTNDYAGEEICVVCTHRKGAPYYILRAAAFGVTDLTPQDIQMTDVICNWNGVEFSTKAFTHAVLREIMLDDIESELLQLTGRARAIREEKAAVHLFSDVPVKGFNYITKKLSQIEVIEFRVTLKNTEEELVGMPTYTEVLTGVTEVLNEIKPQKGSDVVYW